MSTARTFSTCGTCGGTLYRDQAAPHGWVHTSQPEPSHRPSPDDGAVSGPGRDDLPRVTASDCRLVGAGDGSVMVYCQPCRSCLCPRATTLNAALGFWEEHCEDSHPAEPVRAEEGYADPWLDPDAAARAVPPPF
jgi:hypothetical protein